MRWRTQSFNILQHFSVTRGFCNFSVGKTSEFLFLQIPVNLFALTYGVACGWSSPNMPFLASEHTPLDQPLTIEEISMAAALVCIGGLAGNILFAWGSNKFGRRYPLMSMAVPNIVNLVFRFAICRQHI